MDIQKEVKNLIAGQLGSPPENIKLGDTFAKDLKIDSLDIVEIVMSVEEKFNIHIPDEMVEKMQTVQDLFNFIKSKV